MTNILAYFWTGLILPLLLPRTPNLWDYILSITLLHFVLCCASLSLAFYILFTLKDSNTGNVAVSEGFPQTGAWWAMFVCCTLYCIGLAVGMQRCLVRFSKFCTDPRAE